MRIDASCNPGGFSRRDFLRVGGLAVAGLNLPRLLAGVNSGQRDISCIVFFQNGGMSQLDSFDPKPDAPVEYRGEFTSIPSNLPGYRVSELMPNLAQMCDKLAILRSVHHTMMDHGEGMHHVSGILVAYARDVPCIQRRVDVGDIATQDAIARCEPPCGRNGREA